MCLYVGASLSGACKEPYKIMLERVGGLISPSSDEEEGSVGKEVLSGAEEGKEALLLPTKEAIRILHYFKDNSEGLKIGGVSLTKQEIGRSLYLFVTVVAVVLLQVTPLNKGDDDDGGDDDSGGGGNNQFLLTE